MAELYPATLEDAIASGEVLVVELGASGFLVARYTRQRRGTRLEQLDPRGDEVFSSSTSFDTVMERVYRRLEGRRSLVGIGRGPAGVSGGAR